jgi:hypothetical protein
MRKVMDSTYKCASNLEMMEADGEFLIMDTKQLTVTKLNAMGGKMWGYLQQEMELDQIFSAIQEEYAIKDADVKRDLTVFLRELCEMGLVEFGPIR